LAQGAASDKYAMQIREIITEAGGYQLPPSYYYEIPAWLTKPLFLSKIPSVAQQHGWVSVRPNGNLYKILVQATLKRINENRYTERRPQVNLATDLLYFKPEKSPGTKIQELQEPLGDLSAAQQTINRIQSQARAQTQEEPAKGEWYVCVDVASASHYNFPVYFDSSSNTYVAPGSPGFSGRYWNPKPPFNTSFGGTLNTLSEDFAKFTKFK
jgi:hypothetical protein